MESELQQSIQTKLTHFQITIQIRRTKTIWQELDVNSIHTEPVSEIYVFCLLHPDSYSLYSFRTFEPIEKQVNNAPSLAS